MVLPWQRRIERSSIEESNDFGIRVMTVQYKIMTSSHRPRGFAPSRVGLLLDIVCHLSAVAVQYIGPLFNLDMHLQSLKVPNQKHVCNHQLFDWGLWRLLSHETSCIKHFDQAGLILIQIHYNIRISHTQYHIISLYHKLFDLTGFPIALSSSLTTEEVLQNHFQNEIPVLR